MAHNNRNQYIDLHLFELNIDQNIDLCGCVSSTNRVNTVTNYSLCYVC